MKTILILLIAVLILQVFVVCNLLWIQHERRRWKQQYWADYEKDIEEWRKQQARYVVDYQRDREEWLKQTAE